MESENWWLKNRAEIAAATSRAIESENKAGDQTDNYLLSLSGGALVFSITFVDDFAPAKLWLPILFFAWICFAISLLAVGFGKRRAHAHLVQTTRSLSAISKLINSELGKEASETLQAPALDGTVSEASKVGFWNALAFWSFVVGIISFGFFAALNLWKSLPAG